LRLGILQCYNNNIENGIEEVDNMSEKLIQLRVEDNVKDKADEIFKAQGLTTQTAIKIFLTQVANTGESPFDNLFSSNKN
jgi:DNA-damage-inducible protein J